MERNITNHQNTDSVINPIEPDNQKILEELINDKEIKYDNNNKNLSPLSFSLLNKNFSDNNNNIIKADNIHLNHIKSNHMNNEGEINIDLPNFTRNNLIKNKNQYSDQNKGSENKKKFFIRIKNYKANKSQNDMNNNIKEQSEKNEFDNLEKKQRYIFKNASFLVPNHIKEIYKFYNNNNNNEIKCKKGSKNKSIEYLRFLRDKFDFE